MIDTGLALYSSSKEYDHYVRLMHAVIKQPEYSQLVGPFWRWALYGARWLVFHLWRKRIIQELFSVELDGIVVGGFEMSHKGELGSLVVTHDASIRKTVISMISKKGDRLFSDLSRRYSVRTFNPSLVRAMKRRGFCEIPNKKVYIVTIPIGIFRFALTTRMPPKCLRSSPNTMPLIHLERPARISSSEIIDEEE